MWKDKAEGKQCDYVETSGTSMAAPHVSGVIAAFLSVRGEFIGEAGEGEGNFPLHRDRLKARPLFSRCGSGRSDARHPVSLTIRNHTSS